MKNVYTTFEQFSLNEAKKAKKKIEIIDEETEKFNDMLNAISNHCKKNLEEVAKAFGYSKEDVAEGKFKCNKELDYADEAQIEKVFKKLKLKLK